MDLLPHDILKIIIDYIIFDGQFTIKKFLELSKIFKKWHIICKRINKFYTINNLIIRNKPIQFVEYKKYCFKKKIIICYFKKKSYRYKKKIFIKKI